MKPVSHLPARNVGWRSSSQEGNIGLDAADAEFAQRAVHARGGIDEVAAEGRDLDQQRIVIRSDHGAGEGGAAVEADAEARGGAVGAHAAVIGHEIVRGVFGGDAALDREAVSCNLVLRRQRVCGSLSLKPSAMRICALDQVDAGHHSVTVCSTWMRVFISIR